MTDQIDWIVLEKDNLATLNTLGQHIAEAVDGQDWSRFETMGECREWRKKVSHISGLVRPQFTTPIFMGSWLPGGGGSTRAQCALAYLDLSEGMSCLGGIEQNGGQGTKFDEESDVRDRKRLEEITRNLATALGCKHLLKSEEEVP